MATQTLNEKAKDFERRVERRAGLDSERLEAAGMDPAVYLRVVLNAGVLNPNLFDCDERSMDEAIMASINAGLLPDGKEAAIVPYKGKAVFQPMADGRLKLAHKATRGLSIRKVLVYQSDDFEYSEGMNPVLEHTIDPHGSRADEDLVAVYAVAHQPNQQQPTYVVLYRADIERYRAFSASSSSAKSPWNSHYPEMSKKTALHRLLDLLPVPTGLEHLVAADDDVAASLNESAGWANAEMAEMGSDEGPIPNAQAEQPNAPAEASGNASDDGAPF